MIQEPVTLLKKLQLLDDFGLVGRLCYVIKDNQNITKSIYFDNAEPPQKRITVVKNTK